MRQQTGSILLEALIGIVLFLIGILGLAGLYTASMKNAGEAQYRAEAIAMANSLIAEMRTANPTTRPTGYKEGGADYSRWVSRIKNTSNGVEIKLSDKLKAQEMLARSLGMFTDNLNLKGEGYEDMISRIKREAEEKAKTQ